MFQPDKDLFKDYLKKKYPNMPESYLNQLLETVADKRIGKILAVVGDDKADALYKTLGGELPYSATLGKLITPAQILARAGTKKYNQEQAREAILQILCEHLGVAQNGFKEQTTEPHADIECAKIKHHKSKTFVNLGKCDIDFCGIHLGKTSNEEWNESPHISEVMGENYEKAVDLAFQEHLNSIFSKNLEEN